ncbi:MAG: hypothetical protein Q7R62_03310 [bacterium]|nr:hypothetical protein [bacterium]
MRTNQFSLARGAVALLVVFVVVAAASCTNGARSSYTQAQVARAVHPEMRVMQMCNSTACEKWPSGADLHVYCNGRLVAKIKPKEETAILLPATRFDLKIVAVNSESGEELIAIAKTFGAPPNILPSWAVRWEAFTDPNASPPSTG